MGNTRNNSLKIGERVFNLWAISSDHKFANTLVVPRTTHLEHIESAGHFTANLYVLKQQNGVRNRGNVGISDRVTPHKLLRRIRKKACNFFLFCIASHANYKLTKCVMAHTTGQSRQRINGHSRRLELTDFRFDDLKMIF